MRQFLIALLLAALFATAGCNSNVIPRSFSNALEKGERFELLSISPTPVENGEFHGWPVLGRITITDTATRQRLVNEFRKGVVENQNTAAGCVIKPRHGIRVTHDGNTFDFVICFECMEVIAFVGDQRDEGFLISGSPARAFNQVLKDAKIPLAPGAEEE